MEKVEFPTFLDEKPTVVFGRTGRECSIIAIGLALGYLAWLDLSGIFPKATIGILILKAICALVPVAIAAAVALIKVASVYLEQWVFIGLAYFLVPKVFIYLPFQEREQTAVKKKRQETHYDEDDL